MTGSIITHRQVKSWLKITLTVDSRVTDAVTAFLADLTGTGLEIKAPADSRDRTDHTLPPDIITAYIPAGPQESERQESIGKIEDLKRFLAGLSQFFPGCPPPELHTEIIPEEDWNQTWKKYFTAFKITPSLTIKPSWEENKEPMAPPGTEAAVIEMDPGLAFGTGHHASTQLALLLLEELVLPMKVKPAAVLDIGTGSGILAMAVALFGAGQVKAIDNDPDAVETARRNIARNGLADRIAVGDEDAASLQSCFDIVVANITHDTLTELAGNLANFVKQHGFLVLSGILQGDQELSIRKTYAGLGLEFSRRLARDEWVALQFTKP